MESSGHISTHVHMHTYICLCRGKKLAADSPGAEISAPRSEVLKRSKTLTCHGLLVDFGHVFSKILRKRCVFVSGATKQCAGRGFVPLGQVGKCAER